MDLNTVFSDYWELLNLCEDYVKGGYRSDHEPAPAFRFEAEVPPAVEGTTSPGESAPSDPGQTGGPLSERIAACRRCDLHMARKQAVAGAGPDNPRLVILLPPPGYDEDEQNVPLAGEASEFLDKWLTAVGVKRDEIYLTNSIKCRTPGTRPPFDPEVDACRSFLEEQLNLLQPEAVLVLGDTALASLSGERGGPNLDGQRGKPFFRNNIFCLATYDPTRVLKEASLKRPVWEDLKILRDFLNHG